MTFKKVTHVIFDMDGLLIESETGYDKILHDIAQSYGKEYTVEMKLEILGKPEQDTAKFAVSAMNLPITPEEFLNIYKEKVYIELQRPPLMPGAWELVDHFYQHKIPIAVATSSSLDAMQLKTQSHQEMFAKFHHIVCGSSDKDVKNGKPAPDIFLVCASRFPAKPDPDQNTMSYSEEQWAPFKDETVNGGIVEHVICLVFEDAPNGIQGARSAQMQAVMVPPPEVTKAQRQLATMCLNSLNEFKPELFGLPPRHS